MALGFVLALLIHHVMHLSYVSEVLSSSRAQGVNSSFPCSDLISECTGISATFASLKCRSW